MKSRELENLGIPQGEITRLAIQLTHEARTIGLKKASIRKMVQAIVQNPAVYQEDPYWQDLARALMGQSVVVGGFQPRPEPAPWKQWGDNLESDAIRQMQNACELPVSVAGALMPDAHVGYGLPIGGVLATENAVIPYAVGVDIACRMKMSIMDMPVSALEQHDRMLTRVLQEETSFGIGATFSQDRRRDHAVMSEDWGVSPVTKQMRDKAWKQLGSSGSGNHFVEYGIVTLEQPEFGLVPGQYLAILSHSGSRGTGASVAEFYSRLAMNQHPELPKHLRHLAWLDMDSQAGQEYWAAMNLMGHYAAANHACIHQEMLHALGTSALVQIENHHNFCWVEEHEGRTLYVHRKGATPANLGELGIIPGSMATPAFVVRGKANASSLRSAAHGAGRVMSRKQAKTTFSWRDVHQQLKYKGVTLLSADLDEVPGVYKDIHWVMAQQQDLVEVVARFDPKIVKMAPAGEKPED